MLHVFFFLWSKCFSGYHISERRDSIVSIVSRVWAGRFRVHFPAWTRNASFLQNIQTGCGAHPASWVDGVVWKWQGHETDHLPPYGAEVKNHWSYTSSPPLSFHGFYRENFTPIVLPHFPPILNPSLSHYIGVFVTFLLNMGHYWFTNLGSCELWLFSWLLL